MRSGRYACLRPPSGGFAVLLVFLAGTFLPAAFAAPGAAPGPPPELVRAQTAYRQGREAQARGRITEAQNLFREAASLDPNFPDPRFALAVSYLPFRPQAAVSAAADGFRTQCRTFRGQHLLILNSALLLLAILAGGIIATSTLIAVRRLRHFQHPLQEVIGKRLPPVAAATAAWLLIAQPVLWGLGLFLLLTLSLGLLWCHQNPGEKRISIALLALSLIVPFSFHGLSRLAAPLNPESVPYLLSAASESPDQPGLGDALTRATTQNPSDPGPHVALGLLAEQRSDWTLAEAEYREALELGGPPGRIRNNLGNVLLQAGKPAQAVEEYDRAVAADASLAAPHLNLAQACAILLRFDRVDEEIRKASALDFEGVRASLSTGDPGARKPVSLGVSPRELWEATLHSQVGYSLGLPRTLAWLYGGSLKILPVLALLLFGIGFFVGQRIHRFLPTYDCSNCGAVVCRKCLRRVRRRAYCAQCGDTILALKTSEFTRMLLDRRLREDPWPKKLAHFVSVLVIPGWEAVRRGRPFVGLVLMTAFMGLLIPMVLKGLPIRSVPSLVDVRGATPWLWLATGLVVLYGVSTLALRMLPEPESALMGPELGTMPERSEPMDRAA